MSLINRISLIATFPNKGKESTLTSFFDNSKIFVERVINDLWTVGYNDFNPSSKHFNSPKFLDSSHLERFNSGLGLGGMLRQTLGAIALSRVTSITEKLRKKQWVIGKIQSKRDKGESLSVTDRKTLHRFTKEIGNWIKNPPKVTNFAINISRPDVVKTFTENKEGREFAKETEVVKLSLAGDYGVITIPVIKTKQSKKLEDSGFVKKPSAVALYSPTKIGLIYQREITPKKKEGKTVGADQGITTVLTLSDRQVTDKNKHGQCLNDVLKKLSRRKKGTIGFRKAQTHRKNFINWSINRLNFKDVKVVRLEHLKNVGKGQHRSRFLNSWTYPLIRQKLVSLSELEGFQIEEMSNKFRSQRCNCCSHVNKANRKGKAFNCKHCGHTDDADLNSSLNLELDLPRVPNWVFEQKLNRTGFFWTEEGVFAEEQVISQDKETKDDFIHL